MADCTAQPISPYELIECYQNSRIERKQELIKAINDFLLRQTRSLLANGCLDYMDIEYGEDETFLDELTLSYQDAGWTLEREHASRVLRFKLPGKIIGNGEGHG